MQKKPVASQKRPPKSHYRRWGLIGQGQFGQVFCGIHRQRGVLVALKDLHPERFPTHKFLRELRILMSLRHPNIVSCQGMEHHRKGRYLLMDYCEGGTLRDLMDCQGQLNLILALNLVKDILAGLAHAHQNEIIHCDLKPENILLECTEQGWRARITDFGVARVLHEDGGSSSGLGDTGSPAYMAPERYYGEYSAASDLYAVGVILFELVVGDRPFSGLPGELMSAHISRPVVIPSSVPKVITPIIKRGMEKLISRRYFSANEMLKDLEEAIEILGKNIPPFPFFSPPNLGNYPEVLPVVQEEIFPEALLDLIVIKNCLYLGLKNQIIGRVYAEEILNSEIKEEFTVKLNQAFVNFKPSDRHCFFISKNFPSSLYDLGSLNLSNSEVITSLLSGEGNPLLNAIENQGYWRGLIEEKEGQVYLKISNFNQQKPLKIKLKNPTVTGITVINAHYGMIYYHEGENRTVLKIFNRKGRFIYSLKIPRIVQRIIPCLNQSYRYLILDREDKNLGFFLDLKPYRLLPISFGLTPDLIINIAQGFALFNNQGEGVILDQDGEQSNKFKLPVKPLAITAYGEKYLLVTTQTDQEVKLLLIDYQNMIKKQQEQ